MMAATLETHGVFLHIIYCVWASAHMSQACLEVRGQLEDVGCFLPQYGDRTQVVRLTASIFNPLH